jgi:hypothetical protein
MRYRPPAPLACRFTVLRDGVPLFQQECTAPGGAFDELRPTGRLKTVGRLAAALARELCTPRTQRVSGDFQGSGNKSVKWLAANLCNMHIAAATQTGFRMASGEDHW